MITHGESKTKLNKVWRNIKDRCFNQNNNFSRNRNITYRGKTLSISQWAKLSGLHRNTIDFRIKKGWDIEDVFNKPLQQHGRSESHIGNMITDS